MLARKASVCGWAAVLLFHVYSGTLALPTKETLVYEIRMKTTFGDAGKRKMTMKGTNFVWEGNAAGIPIKLIKNQDGAFLIHRSGEFAAKYPKGSSRESPMSMLPGPIGDVKSFLKQHQAKYVGKDHVGKKKCQVYSYTEKVTKWRCKLWADEKTLTPVQLSMSDGKPANDVTVTYLSYKRNVPVDDSVFVLPKGMRLRDMPGYDEPPTPHNPDDAKGSGTKAK